jgi:hypothetical protein
MGTRTVTGTVYKPDGSAWAAGEVTFTLLDGFETATEVYPPEEHIETLDANGQFSITLGVPDTGTAHYSVTLPDGTAYRFYLASGAATNLVTLITIATTAVAQDDLQTLLDANNALTVTTQTTTYNILVTDDLIRCNGTFTVALPAATGTGKPYTIKNVGSGLITIDGNGSDTIDGSLTQSLLSLESLTLVDSATGVWDII